MMFYDGESLRPWFDSGKIVNIESFDIATSHEELGFKFKHLGRLYDVFQWPDTIRVDSGGEDRSKDYDVNGEKAFLFFLARSYKCHVLTSTEQFWGWSYQTASRFFLASEKWMVDNHGHRLTNLAFFVPRFKMYNDAIRWRIVTMNGDRLPPEAELCVSFLDRVSCRIYCPFGPWLWQRQWWNFKSKFHYLASQAMTFPDGVAGFEYGSMIEYVRAAHH